MSFFYPLKSRKRTCKETSVFKLWIRFSIEESVNFSHLWNKQCFRIDCRDTRQSQSEFLSKSGDFWGLGQVFSMPRQWYADTFLSIERENFSAKAYWEKLSLIFCNEVKDFSAWQISFIPVSLIFSQLWEINCQNLKEENTQRIRELISLMKEEFWWHLPAVLHLHLWIYSTLKSSKTKITASSFTMRRQI